MATKVIAAGSTPLHKRIVFFIKIWGLKTLTNVFIILQQRYKPLSPSQLPTLLKTYPQRNHLTNRVFIPQTHKAGQVLPLYLNIHGGGFALCNPSFDDEFCAHLCNRFNILVASLDYSKAPRASFPVPVDEIEALVKAVLSDESLPIDKTRVAIGGFSAGGNLALSAVQAPDLKGKIHAVVPWYPVVDWVTDGEQKAKSRPYSNEKEIDSLTSMMHAFRWGYVKPGENLTNPRLSVRYANKDDLPKWIFMLAAEYDLLCNEAKEMVMSLADLKGVERDEGLYEFERGIYRWRMARGVEHGWTQSFGPASEGDMARKRREETFEEVGQWLFKGPFAKGT